MVTSLEIEPSGRGGESVPAHSSQVRRSGSGQGCGWTVPSGRFDGSEPWPVAVVTFPWPKRSCALARTWMLGLAVRVEHRGLMCSCLDTGQRAAPSAYGSGMSAASGNDAPRGTEYVPEPRYGPALIAGNQGQANRQPPGSAE